MRASIGRALAALLALASVAGCNQVFGWEEAKLDPSVSSKGGSGGQAGSSETCDEYCAFVMQNCRGDLIEYGSTEVCMEMCRHIEPGFIGEKDTNTLACRLFHAQLAANDPVGHCRAAGPLGGDVCGDRCDAYCLFVMPLCSDQAEPPFPDLTSCRASCSSFVYDKEGPDFTPDVANTLNCRLYHLESAFDDPHHHCPHTAARSLTCE